ncbi:MAG: hypothetical protein DDT28_00792 [Dehalococcoidia bacterium]|nr:hypothetical protein [Chloroflexota bacterium]MBT9166358.1 hypothetical protein [Chloroflexota bacterium]
MVLENLFLYVRDVFDISSGFSATAIGLFFLIAMLGEVYLQIPLLMESLWLLVGYQSRVNNIALFNTTLILLTAQAGRQASMLALYYFFPVINKSLSKFLVKPVMNKPLLKLLLKPIQINRFHRKHLAQDHFDTRYLSSVPATLGMLTWLNGPIKLVLVWRRRLKPLLVGTLFSGLVFDGIYLLAGALFRTTELSIAYLPAVFLAVFLAFMYVQTKVVKNVPQV